MRFPVLLNFAFLFISSWCAELTNPSSGTVIWGAEPGSRRFYTSQDVDEFHNVMEDSNLPHIVEHSGFFARFLATHNSLLATVLGLMFKSLCDSDGLLGFLAVFFAVALLETIFGVVHTGSTYKVHQRYKSFFETRGILHTGSCISKPGYSVLDALRTFLSTIITLATAITLATKDQSMCADESSNLFHDKVYLGFLLVPCLLQAVLRIFDPQSVGKIEREYRLSYFKHL